MYRIIALIKSIRRRWLFQFGKPSYTPYGDPSKIGGWSGWYEVGGECIAFRDMHSKKHFAW